MLESVNKFEKGIYYILMILLAAVIFIGVIELIIIFIMALLTDLSYRLTNHEILQIFGYFLLILIGIELLETIKAYLIKNEIHVEIIILVAIILAATSGWFNSGLPKGSDARAVQSTSAVARDQLLQHERLSGWSTHWYLGYPLYYMFPSLGFTLLWALSIPFGWIVVHPGYGSPAPV